MAVKAKSTIVGYAAIGAGPFTPIVGLVGEPVLPETEYEVQKFQANDDVNPTLIVGDPETGGVEVVVAYADHAAWVTLSGLAGSAQYVEFKLQNGDEYVYYGVVAKVGPLNAAEEGAGVGVIGFVFSHLESSASGP